jgi:hypothetical protein
MHHEFNNRIAAQRTILRVVNRKPFGPEQLFGLSSKAIDRWVSVNRIEPTARIVGLVREVSSKLFFLANKSQQQISEEYSIVQGEIAAASYEIERELQALSG